MVPRRPLLAHDPSAGDLAHGLASALRARGLDVRAFDAGAPLARLPAPLRRALRDEVEERTATALLAAAAAHAADALVVVGGARVPWTAVRALRDRGLPRVAWHPFPPWSVESNENSMHGAQFYGACFGPDAWAAPFYARYRVPFEVMAAAVPAVARQATGEPVAIDPDPLLPAAVPAAAFAAAAEGAALVVPWREDLPARFEPGAEVLPYRDDAERARHLATLRADASLARRLGEAARVRVAREHTFEPRAERLLAALASR